MFRNKHPYFKYVVISTLTKNDFFSGFLLKRAVTTTNNTNYTTFARDYGVCLCKPVNFSPNKNENNGGSPNGVILLTSILSYLHNLSCSHFILCNLDYISLLQQSFICMTTTKCKCNCLAITSINIYLLQFFFFSVLILSWISALNAAIAKIYWHHLSI